LAVADAHFVLDSHRFTEKVYPLYRVLRSIGYHVHVVRETTPENDDPVDCFILAELGAILRDQLNGRAHRIAIVAHDHYYAVRLAEILHAGGAVSVLGFREELSPELLSLERLGGEIMDLEHDVGAFLCRLPRPCLPL
jgi:hypothetical protein